MSQGIEVDGLLAVNDNLTIGASVGYLQAEYKEFNVSCPLNALEAAKVDCVEIDGELQQSLSGFQIENAPKLTGTMFAEYFTTISDMNAGVRLDANYKDDITLSTSQDSHLTEDAYTKVNINFTLTSAEDTWSASLGVFNLTDEQPITFGGETAFVPGLYYVGTERGREIKASATYYWF
ncbi:TonB-dependent receptor [Colwellia sp. 20A7]|uniref:TonB-dependent receptor n=1 Tax=Colwellia sp. 20A7 TaxID=2689569 RepID=UPI0022A6CE6E|nr:TonB-dependent receptor [Colwellia sp. 20A7]